MRKERLEEEYLMSGCILHSLNKRFTPGAMLGKTDIVFGLQELTVQQLLHLYPLWELGQVSQPPSLRFLICKVGASTVPLLSRSRSDQHNNALSKYSVPRVP